MTDEKASDDSAESERLARVMNSSVEDLHNRVGLPSEFFKKLTEEDDDWSFIVKGHALIEAAMNDLLVNALGKKSLEKFIARKQLVAFKLPMAKDLGLVASYLEGLIRIFSDLRNICVHHAQNLTFSLKAHIDSLDNASDFIKVTTGDHFFVIDVDTVRSNPRLVLAKLLEAVLGTLNLHIRLLQARQKALKAFLMCKPMSEGQVLLWELAKEVPPDV